MQAMLLNAILAIAQLISPFRINSAVSKLKVENVLNPPHNPITIISRKFSCSAFLKDDRKKINARITTADILDKKVATGKLKEKKQSVAFEIR